MTNVFPVYRRWIQQLETQTRSQPYPDSIPSLNLSISHRGFFRICCPAVEQHFVRITCILSLTNATTIQKEQDPVFYSFFQSPRSLFLLFLFCILTPFFLSMVISFFSIWSSIGQKGIWAQRERWGRILLKGHGG